MSKKRKGRPNRPHIPVTKISSQDASKFRRDVTSAPLLELPDTQSETKHGLILNVRRVGFLGNDPSVIYTGQGNAYLQTTDGEYYRLPTELGLWARDVITMTLAEGGRESGIFPTRIKFGTRGGRAYAEILIDD